MAGTKRAVFSSAYLCHYLFFLLTRAFGCFFSSHYFYWQMYRHVLNICCSRSCCYYTVDHIIVTDNNQRLVLYERTQIHTRALNLVNLPFCASQDNRPINPFFFYINSEKNEWYFKNNILGLVYGILSMSVAYLSCSNKTMQLFYKTA